MTVARQVVPGRTYLISRRCSQRHFFLRPDSYVEQAYLYCLGEAAARFDITLHGFIAMRFGELGVIFPRGTYRTRGHFACEPALESVA